MGYLMNSQKEILICRGPNHVRSDQKLPRKNRGITKQVRTGNLEGDDGENKVFGQWFGAAQLGYLGRSANAQQNPSFGMVCAPRDVP